MTANHYHHPVSFRILFKNCLFSFDSDSVPEVKLSLPKLTPKLKAAKLKGELGLHINDFVNLAATHLATLIPADYNKKSRKAINASYSRMLVNHYPEFADKTTLHGSNYVMIN